MIIKLPEKTDKDLNKWHVWYAWYPVILKHNGTRCIVWFEWVNRRRMSALSGWYWIYDLGELK